MVRTTRKHSPRTHDTHSHTVAYSVSSAPSTATETERKSKRGQRWNVTEGWNVWKLQHIVKLQAYYGGHFLFWLSSKVPHSFPVCFHYRIRRCVSTSTCRRTLKHVTHAFLLRLTYTRVFSRSSWTFRKHLSGVLKDNWRNNKYKGLNILNRHVKGHVEICQCVYVLYFFEWTHQSNALRGSSCLRSYSTKKHKQIFQYSKLFLGWKQMVVTNLKLLFCSFTAKLFKILKGIFRTF